MRVRLGRGMEGGGEKDRRVAVRLGQLSLTHCSRTDRAWARLHRAGGDGEARRASEEHSRKRGGPAVGRGK